VVDTVNAEISIRTLTSRRRRLTVGAEVLADADQPGQSVLEDSTS
jgi:hypothetical protein